MRRNKERGPQEEFLLRPGELRSLFPMLEVRAYREGLVERESERGTKAVAGLVARKAASHGAVS